MKKFIQKNKLYLGLLVTIFMIMIVVNISYRNATAENLNDGDTHNYSELVDGDIINFNDKITGNFTFMSRTVTYPTMEEAYYKLNAVTSVLKVNYCNSTSIEYCKANAYSYRSTPLLSTGIPNEFTYNVKSYSDMFPNETANYKAWKVYLVPQSYAFRNYNYYLYQPLYSTIYYPVYYPYNHYNVYSSSNQQIYLLGEYYDIYLVPTEEDINDCYTNGGSTEWSREIDFDAIIVGDNWKDNDNIYTFTGFNMDKDENVLSFKFNANSGDKVMFDMLTTHKYTTITLDGEIFNFGNYEEYFTKYKTVTLDIESDGEHTLEISASNSFNFYNNTSEINVKDVGLYELINKGSEVDSSKITNEDTIVAINVCSSCNASRIVMNKHKLEITKKDEDGNLLKGAVLELVDKEGTVVKKWNTSENNPMLIIGLENGSVYTLREVSSPNGYEKAKDIEITIDNTKDIQEISMVDKKISNPNTGDNIITFMLISILSIVTIVISTYTIKRA